MRELARRNRQPARGGAYERAGSCRRGPRLRIAIGIVPTRNSDTRFRFRSVRVARPDRPLSAAARAETVPQCSCVVLLYYIILYSIIPARETTVSRARLRPFHILAPGVSSPARSDAAPRSDNGRTLSPHAEERTRAPTLRSCGPRGGRDPCLARANGGRLRLGGPPPAAPTRLDVGPGAVCRPAAR